MSASVKLIFIEVKVLDPQLLRNNIAIKRAALGLGSSCEDDFRTVEARNKDFSKRCCSAHTRRARLLAHGARAEASGGGRGWVRARGREGRARAGGRGRGGGAGHAKGARREGTWSEQAAAHCRTHLRRARPQSPAQLIADWRSRHPPPVGPPPPPRC